MEGCFTTVGNSSSIYSLKWNNFQTCLASGLVELLEDIEYSMTDVTLACEGQFLQAHKVALAVSSPFFRQFFKLHRVERAGITLIALTNVKFRDLRNVIQFIYHGEVNLSKEDVKGFLETAKSLKIQGLSDTPLVHQDCTGTNVQSNQLRVTSPVCLRSNKSFTVTSEPDITQPENESRGSDPSAKRPCLQSQSSHNFVTAHNNEVLGPVSVATFRSSKLSATGIPTMHIPDDGGEEQMIDIGEIKPSVISTYSLDEIEDDNNYGGDGDDGVNSDSARNEGCAGVRNPESSYSESLLSIVTPSNVMCAESSSANFRMYEQPVHTKRKKTATGQSQLNVVSGLHGVGAEFYDNHSNSLNPILRYSCLCGKTFTSKPNRIRHITEMRNAGNKAKIKCHICGKTFYRLRTLRAHQRDTSCSKLIGLTLV